MKPEDISFARLLERASALLAETSDPALLRDAVNLVDRAVLLRPEDCQGWIMKSYAMSACCDDVSALAAAQMAVKVDPAEAEAHFVLAASLADTEQPEAALDAVTRAFDRLPRPDHPMAEDLYFLKAEVLQSQGQTQRAQATLYSGLRRFPHSTLLSTPDNARRRRMLRVIDGGAARKP